MSVYLFTCGGPSNPILLLRKQSLGSVIAFHICQKSIGHILRERGSVLGLCSVLLIYVTVPLPVSHYCHYCNYIVFVKIKQGECSIFLPFYFFQNILTVPGLLPFPIQFRISLYVKKCFFWDFMQNCIRSVD